MCLNLYLCFLSLDTFNVFKVYMKIVCHNKLFTLKFEFM